LSKGQACRCVLPNKDLPDQKKRNAGDWDADVVEVSRTVLTDTVKRRDCYIELYSLWHWKTVKHVARSPPDVLVNNVQTSSCAVAERPRDASCLSVVIFNSTILRARSLLLLVTSASDLPMRTIRFCFALFGLPIGLKACCHKQYSLMRGVSSSVCRDKQTPPLSAINHSIPQSTSCRC